MHLILRELSERDEAAFLVSRIRELVKDGVSLQDIAVFYRVHAQSRVLEDVMRAEKIPYQIVGGTKFFERAEVKDLLSYLRVLTNPRSDVARLRALCSTLMLGQTVGSGHFLQLEVPDQVNAMLDRFLTLVAGASRGAR